MGGKSLVIFFLAFTSTFAIDKGLNGCNSTGVCSGHTKGATIVQNPNDCGSFCVCACGDGIMMNCTKGLEYDAVTKQCDHPYIAKCSTPIPPPTPNGCDAWDSFCASAPSGTLKPNPSDCGSFCECAPVGPVKMDCPAGLHFSVAANRCEWPSIAGCLPGPPPTSGPGPTPPPSPAPSGDCDAVAADCKASPVGTLLRNPSDCGSFCQCAPWGPVKMDCPSGLHFSVATNRCEAPSDAGCIPGPTPTSGPRPTPPPSPPPSGDCDAVAAKCKVSPVGTLLRNPSDCGSFCQCAPWGPVKMDCPAGLHFSVATNRCEAPSDAGCIPGPTPTSGPRPTPPPSPPPSGDCDAVAAKCKVSPVGTLLRNPSDCGSFCQCAPWGPVKMDCPAGLHFSVATNRCEAPSDAGCIPGPTPTSGPRPTPPPSPPPSGDCDAVAATCKVSPVGTLLRNPSDCGSFCQCAPWGPVKMDCPAGLHFSVTTNRCEAPSAAGCIPGPTPTSGPRPTPPPSPPPSGDCDAVAAKCKASPVGTLLRNPSDCGSFCQCAPWGPVKMDCPAGLHFSVATNRCEAPSDAGCIPGPTPTSGPGPTPPPTPPPSGDCDAVATTCLVSPVGTLLRDPSDCGSFCQCAPWGPVKMDCPAGLHFSVSTNRCESPYDAMCI